MLLKFSSLENVQGMIVVDKPFNYVMFKKSGVVIGKFTYDKDMLYIKPIYYIH